jgi:hypothetical protein
VLPVEPFDPPQKVDKLAINGQIRGPGRVKLCSNLRFVGSNFDRKSAQLGTFLAYPEGSKIAKSDCRHEISNFGHFFKVENLPCKDRVRSLRSNVANDPNVLSLTEKASFSERGNSEMVSIENLFCKFYLRKNIFENIYVSDKS